MRDYRDMTDGDNRNEKLAELGQTQRYDKWNDIDLPLELSLGTATRRRRTKEMAFLRRDLNR